MASIYSSPLLQVEPRARNLIEVHPQDDGTDEDNFTSSVLSNAPRLSNKSVSFSGNILRSEEIWTIRKTHQGEEELYARGKCVYWTRNSIILRSFNFTDQVVKVFWSEFNKKDHICVALTSGLSIFNTLGQHFQIPLPFFYQEIHSTETALIIERNCDPLEDSHLPVLFALTHPTQEISPILFKPKYSNPNLSKLSTTNRPLNHVMPSYMSIVACHEKISLCLMYNSQECQHSLWKIRPVTDEELDEHQKYNDESTIHTTFVHHQSTNCSIRDQLSHQSPASLNLSSKQRSSLLMHSNPSSAGTVNFSPKMDLRGRPSLLGNLAASRLGAGGAQMTPDTNASNIKSFNSTNTLNIMSTPNRNRVLNYLRDNIEEPILPELVFDQTWIEPSCNSLKANKFFTYTDMVGDEFLVLVISASNSMEIFKLDPTKKIFSQNQSHKISAIDAMPIKSMNMMIVLDKDRNVILYSGLNRITLVTVPQMQPTNLRSLASSSPANLKGSEITPIQMSSARKRSSIGDKSTFGPDLSMQHLFQTVSPVPHKHDSKFSAPLGLNDIKKIDHVIEESVFVNNHGFVRARFTIPSICQTLCVRRLLDSMKLLVSRDLGLNIITSWYQTRRSSSQPDLMSAKDEMKLFKTWFLSLMDIPGNYFNDVGSSKSKSPDLSMKLLIQSPTKKSRRAKDMENKPMLSSIYSFFFGMHLVFEDLLLMKLNHEIASDLVELLMVLACILNLDEYQNYYWLKFPYLQSAFGNQKDHLESLFLKVKAFQKPVFFQTSPPSIMDFVNKVIVKSKHRDCFKDEPLRPFPYLDGVTDNVLVVLSLFCEMFGIDPKKAIIQISASSSTYPNTDILKYKPSRSKENDERVVTLMTEFGKTKSYLSRLPEAMNLYLWDAILNCRESPPNDWNEACFNLIGRMDLVDLVCSRAKSCKTLGTIGSSEDGDDDTLKLLFPDDIRVSEAHRMLTTNVPVEFSINPRQGATEDETRDETQRLLYLLNIRTMGMPVGRGAIGLRTYSPVIGESFEVPRLELTGKAPNEDRPIEFTHDISVYPWPFFHNGVAAGLTICSSTANNIIDSTWINYNRPRSNMPHGAEMRERDLTIANINNEHAGFLFALGLNGHLEKLSQMALHDYLCQNNDLTKLAILLGMSAAKRGTRDNNIIKVLSIHVDALLPPNSTELDVPALVHAASIIGVGLLYQGSGDSHISKVLLEEIGRMPGPDPNTHVDREAHALSAGLAFGLVNLCRGGSATISSSDQLRLYMLGGQRKSMSLAQRDRYFKQDCHRGEELYINTHITSPGATLALGLMYHRSNNHSVAKWMLPPDTQTLLEYVRPDCLLLRMLSYGLIMWDKVQPTEEFVDALIPEIVSAHAFQRTHASSDKAGLSFSPDYELISQAYCHIVAGCCMAIAMRYAGTGNRIAYKTIYKHTKFLILFNNKPSMVEQAGRSCIESCLNVLVTSLAVLMAGSGDLGVMRVCRYLRSRLTQSCIFYGSYMAIHMALGILFMGSCRYTFSTSPDAISALVCALYPTYPNHTSDNRYHLQPLRHLYVLAAEPRLLIPRDIETNRPVYVNIIVRQKIDSGEIIDIKMRSPCMIPEVESIVSVCVDDERYWRIEIEKKKDLLRCLCQDQGYLSVKQKAHSSNNQLVQAIETYILDNLSPGVTKSRKQSALTECVKEDRVEQYSALNELLTGINRIDARYFSLVFEQIRIASSLADEASPTNKINLLKPVVDSIGDNFDRSKVFDSWCKYISKTTDWNSTDQQVAHYVTFNDLKCSSLDRELVNSLEDLIL